MAPSLALFAGLVGAGFVAVAVGWSVAARTLFVPFQIPALMSGAFGGLAMVMTGASFVSVQLDRRASAAERTATDALLDEVAALVRERAPR